MNTRILKIGGSISALALVSQAFAADTTLPAKNASGSTVQLRVQDDASTLTPAHTVRCVASPTTDCIAQMQATAGSDATVAVSVQGITGGKAVPVSASSLPLPTGAATAAKQPALGTAGTASADVISVQGIASGTNLNVACQSGCSGGTQYAEDAVAASGNTGTVALGVQVASPASTAADGDWTWAQLTGGKLHVIDLSANSALGTTADSAWASGSGSLVALMKTLATAALDTTPASVKIDQTTDGTTNAVHLVAGTAIVGKVGLDQTTPGTTNAVSLAQLGANTIATGNGTASTGTLRVSLASDSTGQVTLAAGTATVGATYGFAGTATTTITRPADTTAYTANDSFGDSTGGHTFSSMCRASGGSGVLTDATFVYSTTQVVVGTVFIYDSSITETDDNAAWSVSDSDQLKLVGTIPFTTVADAVNSYHNVQNLNIGYTCSGSANLRYQVKITTGYTPAASDTLTIRAKFIQSN